VGLGLDNLDNLDKLGNLDKPEEHHQAMVAKMAGSGLSTGRVAGPAAAICSRC